MTFTPRSVEGFRHLYGRAPTIAEFRALMDHDRPTSTPVSNGCDCYDEECSRCNPESK